MVSPVLATPNGAIRNLRRGLTWRRRRFALYTCIQRHLCRPGPRMSTPDLNLLITLDVLLAEGSVARAAKRLRLSPSAMSRALARLRETTGDPLLVRAGRSLVPTPRAQELRSGSANWCRRPRRCCARPSSPTSQSRPHLHVAHQRRVRRELRRRAHCPRRPAGPGVRLRFMHKPDKDSTPLRDGTVDLETGVVGRRRARNCAPRACFATALSVWCAPGIRCARAG